jgi:hypothetical protein
MWRRLLSRNFDLVPKRSHVKEIEMQSFYTATVVNQIIEDRVETATRSRRSPRRRRLFARGARRDAPLTAASGRLRVSGAGR